MKWGQRLRRRGFFKFRLGTREYYRAILISLNKKQQQELVKLNVKSYQIGRIGQHKILYKYYIKTHEKQED